MEETMELTQEERKSMSYLTGERKQCAECKTQFFLARYNQARYVYRKNGRFYCSWTCYRKGRKKNVRRA